MHRTTSIALSASLFAASLAAQSGGPTLAFAHGFSFDPGTFVPPFTAGSVVRGRTDLDATFPLPEPAHPGEPDFGALPIPPGLDVDALSLGLDWIPSDPAGFVAVPPGNWAAATYSVSRATLGRPGTVIASEAQSATGAAADVFAYVFPGSALPADLVDVPFRAQDGDEIALPPGANLDAHDLYIGLIYRENPQLAAMLPPPVVFFSVTTATAGAIPISWAGSADRHGATVFATNWVPATASWSTPFVFLTAAQLGLDATEDLDALAIDLAHGKVVFSTDPTRPPPSPIPPRNPLLHSNLGSGANVPYRLPGGTPVATALGLGSAPDDIDGICFVDPGSPTAPSQLPLRNVLGTPGPAVLASAPVTLQASAARRFDRSSGQERLVTMMTGWPPPGSPSTGFAVAAITIGPPAIGPWISSGLYLRPLPTSPYFVFSGHPERHEFAIPAGWSMSNVPISFVWAAFSATTFTTSHPLTILL